MHDLNPSLKRAWMLLRGAWWLYKNMREYETWLGAFNQHRDPIAASEAYFQKVMARQT